MVCLYNRNIAAFAVTAMICLAPISVLAEQTASETNVKVDDSMVYIEEETEINNGRGPGFSGGTYVSYVKSDGTLYIASQNGNIYANGVAGDGKLYDENGVQANAIVYVRDKYLESFESSRDNDYYSFDSETEANLFVQWWQLERCTRQGIAFDYIMDKNGSTGILKSSLADAKGEPSAEYTQRVNELAAMVSEEETTLGKLAQAMSLVANEMSYDISYSDKTTDEALKDGRGVCYHFTKMTKAVLKAAGIESEYVCGVIKGKGEEEQHVWLQVYDGEFGVWRVVDTTNMDTNPAGALAILYDPTRYAQMYEPAGIIDPNFCIEQAA